MAQHPAGVEALRFVVQVSDLAPLRKLAQPLLKWIIENLPHRSETRANRHVDGIPNSHTSRRTSQRSDSAAVLAASTPTVAHHAFAAELDADQPARASVALSLLLWFGVGLAGHMIGFI